MDHSFKTVFVLTSPNVDIIADVVTEDEHTVTMNNVAFIQWMGDKVQIIPFRAARDLHIKYMPRKNIAFEFEPDPQLADMHDKEIDFYRENPKVFVSKSEHMKKLQERSETIANVLKK